MFNSNTIIIVICFYYLKLGFFLLVLTPLNCLKKRCSRKKLEVSKEGGEPEKKPEKEKNIKFYTSLKKQLIFGDLIIIKLEGFMELLICGTLNVKEPIMNSTGEYAAFVISVYSLISVCIILPMLLAYIMC